MIQGIPNIDGLSIANIEIDFTKNPIHIRARAGFVNTKSGQTMGWTDFINGPWKKETLERLRAFTDSLESDIASVYLDNSSGIITTTEKSPVAVSGLGEFLEKNDAPSV